MPIIVTCECGKSFQAGEQHAGLQAKCKACGRVLVIQGPQVQLAAAPVAVQPLPQQFQQPVSQPMPQAQVYDEQPAGEEMSPEAAAVLLQKEMQGQSDKTFMIRMGMVVIGILIFGGIAAGIYTMTSSEPKPIKKTDFSKIVLDTPKIDTPKVVEQPKPVVPRFDKNTVNTTATQPVKWAGTVAAGMDDDGSMLVTLQEETLQSGSTATYRAKLKLKEKLDAPIPSGTQVIFDGVQQGGSMKQTTDFRQGAGGERLVDAIYTFTVTDGVIVSKTAAGSAATTKTTTTKTPAAADDVEKYILTAIESKDGHARKNAELFKPSDERLKFKAEYRSLPKDAAEVVHKKTDPIATMEDMDAGPAPTPESDLIEARMLMDKDLVGDGLWLDADSGKSKFFVFLAEPTTIMQEVSVKYGSPGKSIKSGKCRLNFYGRIMLVETSDGRVFAVLRKVVWGK